ncbi:MAG: LysM peptidoglycan-binding domain-containing protein [Candidatus Brocadiae bacterium]|nr:LysM peptidoglycan-binding domain-containing protein [Candidatus Brocadiia bacterium]
MTQKNSKYLLCNRPKKTAPVFLYSLILLILTLCIASAWMIISQERPSLVYHIVREGDTLRGLAYQYYKDPHQWSKIFLANRKQLKKRNELRPGEILVIPMFVHKKTTK